jgi:hypothetical protein
MSDHILRSWRVYNNSVEITTTSHSSANTALLTHGDVMLKAALDVVGEDTAHRKAKNTDNETVKILEKFKLRMIHMMKKSTPGQNGGYVLMRNMAYVDENQYENRVSSRSAIAYVIPHLQDKTAPDNWDVSSLGNDVDVNLPDVRNKSRTTVFAVMGGSLGDNHIRPEDAWTAMAEYAGLHDQDLTEYMNRTIGQPTNGDAIEIADHVREHIVKAASLRTDELTDTTYNHIYDQTPIGLESSAGTHAAIRHIIKNATACVNANRQLVTTKYNIDHTTVALTTDNTFASPTLQLSMHQDPWQPDNLSVVSAIGNGIFQQCADGQFSECRTNQRLFLRSRIPFASTTPHIGNVKLPDIIPTSNFVLHVTKTPDRDTSSDAYRMNPTLLIEFPTEDENDQKWCIGMGVSDATDAIAVTAKALKHTLSTEHKITLDQQKFLDWAPPTFSQNPNYLCHLPEFRLACKLNCSQDIPPIFNSNGDEIQPDESTLMSNRFLFSSEFYIIFDFMYGVTHNDERESAYTKMYTDNNPILKLYDVGQQQSELLHAQLNAAGPGLYSVSFDNGTCTIMASDNNLSDYHYNLCVSYNGPLRETVTNYIPPPVMHTNVNFTNHISDRDWARMLMQASISKVAIDINCFRDYNNHAPHWFARQQTNIAASDFTLGIGRNAYFPEGDVVTTRYIYQLVTPTTVNRSVSAVYNACFGWHHSNLRALRRTVAATIVDSTTLKNVYVYLNTPYHYYNVTEGDANDIISNATNSQNNEFLAHINQEYCQSFLVRLLPQPRHEERFWLVHQARVRVRGPGKNDLVTSCDCRDIYVITSRFLELESEIWTGLQAILTRTQHTARSRCTGNCIATELGSGQNAMHRHKRQRPSTPVELEKTIFYIWKRCVKKRSVLLRLISFLQNRRDITERSTNWREKTAVNDIGISISAMLMELLFHPFDA